MFYTIYKITNLINGKIYIGKHQTKNPTDAYYGSGKAIQNAIKLHGKHNFSKEVLHIFETDDEMNAKERDLITEEFVARQDTYNLGVGGEGGPHFKGRVHSQTTKETLRKKTFDFFTENERKKMSERKQGIKHSDEAKQKIADKRKNTCQTQETKNKISESLRGKKLSEERKLKIIIGIQKKKKERENAAG